MLGNAGILSCLPPVICIFCALLTKEVIFSIFVGILSAAAIYSKLFNAGIVGFFRIIFDTMSNCIYENAMIIVFIMILGSLIHVIDLAGGAEAYRDFASKKIKSGRMAMILTAVFGTLIMIDDYFIALTVGIVMRPIIDKHRVSRAKFACVLDLIATPICFLVPISSLSALVVSCLNNSDFNGSEIFFKMIPYNFYPILAVFFAFFMASGGFKDFGKMAKVVKFEKRENETIVVGNTNVLNSKKANVFDLILPIFALILISIWLINVTNDTIFGITVASLLALILSFFMFIPRKLITFKQFMNSIIDGMNLMLSAIVTLTLAWTLSDLTREYLGTGDFLASAMSKVCVYDMFMPAIIFLFSTLLAYSTGSSCATFAILIPVACAICGNLESKTLLYSLSAVISGAVAGSNCSPISNTMIMVSGATGCDHITHVFTELPYALCVTGCAFFGFLILGITQSFIFSFFTSLLLLVATSKFFGSRFSTSPKSFRKTV